MTQFAVVLDIIICFVAGLLGNKFICLLFVMRCLGDGENECNDDSDESDGDESVSGVSTGGNGDGSGISSDESDGGSEKCAICLQRFQGQEIGSPETCEHHFCLKCITEWSKVRRNCVGF